MLASDVYPPASEPAAQEVAQQPAGRRLASAPLAVQDELDTVALTGAEKPGRRRPAGARSKRGGGGGYVRRADRIRHGLRTRTRRDGRLLPPGGGPALRAGTVARIRARGRVRTEAGGGISPRARGRGGGRARTHGRPEIHRWPRHEACGRRFRRGGKRRSPARGRGRPDRGGGRRGAGHGPDAEGADEAAPIPGPAFPVVHDLDLPPQPGERVGEGASLEPRPFPDDRGIRDPAEADRHPVLVQEHRAGGDREVAVAKRDLVEGVPRTRRGARRGGRPAGRNHHLVLPARGLQGAFEERARRYEPFAARRTQPHRSVQQREDEGQLGARVRVRDGAAHRAARAGRVVPDVGERFRGEGEPGGEPRPAPERGLGDPGPDLDLRAVVRDLLQRPDAAHVDHDRRGDQPEVHHRHEGEPAREEPGVVPRLREGRHRRLDPVRAQVVERGGLHARSSTPPSG